MNGSAAVTKTSANRVSLACGSDGTLAWSDYPIEVTAVRIDAGPGRQTISVQ